MSDRCDYCPAPATANNMCGGCAWSEYVMRFEGDS